MRMRDSFSLVDAGLYSTSDDPVLDAQVVNLHYMLSKTVVKARPSVLWCYKKDLYLSRCEPC